MGKVMRGEKIKASDVRAALPLTADNPKCNIDRMCLDRSFSCLDRVAYLWISR